jgi:hypothetical protein
LKKSSKLHKWTENDDIVVLYLYRFNDIGFPFTRDKVAEKLGMSVASLNMRIGNFKAIAGEGGLSHPAKQSGKIYKKFNGMPKTELRSLVLEILNE